MLLMTITSACRQDSRTDSRPDESSGMLQWYIEFDNLKILLAIAGKTVFSRSSKFKILIFEILMSVN